MNTAAVDLRPSVLIVMHEPLAPAGLLGHAVIEAGGRTTVLLPHERTGRPDVSDGIPPDDGSHDAVVVLGGAMHAGDDDGFPHFPPLLDLIRGFHGLGKPVLGICLGAQLVARAFGQPVLRQGFLEIGFQEVTLTAAAADDPLLHGLGPNLVAMQWHEDAVAVPDAGVLLGRSAGCANQIFRIGRTTYGFQGHVEVTPEIVRDWVRSRESFLTQNEPEFLMGFERSLEQNMRGAMCLGRVLARRWLKLVLSSAVCRTNKTAPQ
jgi:GMP synthase (glutamine-hydrolysing)